MRAHELSLAVGPSGSYAAWHGGTSSSSSIHIQRLDREGRRFGEIFTPSDGERLAYEPDLILSADMLVVAWYEKDERTGHLSARLAALALDGTPRWTVRLKSRGDVARNPVVRRVGDRLHVAWIAHPLASDGTNEASVWHQRFTLDGKADGDAREIGSANRDTWNLNAASAADSFIISYDAALGTRAHELHMLLVTGDVVTHRQLSPDDGRASLYPDLQVSASGQAAVSWHDERDGNREIYLLTTPLSSLIAGGAPAAVRITQNPGASVGAYLAWQGDAIGLAWTDEVDGRSKLFWQRRSVDGNVVEFGKEESDAMHASPPAIRALHGAFLLAWNDYALDERDPLADVKSSVLRTNVVGRQSSGGH
jgi:hypothetical protein